MAKKIISSNEEKGKTAIIFFKKVVKKSLDLEGMGGQRRIFRVNPLREGKGMAGIRRQIGEDMILFTTRDGEDGAQ